MAIGLESIPVLGIDGERGSLFFLLEGGTATYEDGWKVQFGASVGSGALIGYVSDSAGRHVATYRCSAVAFCEEALRMGRAKIAKLEGETDGPQEASSPCS